MSKASNLISLLEMAATSADKKKAEDSMKRLAAKFFPDMPLPKVMVRDNLATGWAGKHTRYPDSSKNTIDIQKYVIDAGGEELDKVMAHELIHQWQAINTESGRNFDRSYAKLSKNLDLAHGETFKAWADRINKEMGDGFVTPKSDLIVAKTTKSFCIMIAPSHSYKNKYCCYTFQKVTNEVVAYISQHKEIKLFVTDDWALAHKRLKSFYIPMDDTVQAKLKKLYEEGDPIEI